MYSRTFRAVVLAAVLAGALLAASATPALAFGRYRGGGGFPVFVVPAPAYAYPPPAYYYPPPAYYYPPPAGYVYTPPPPPPPGYVYTPPVVLMPPPVVLVPPPVFPGFSIIIPFRIR